MHLVCFSIAFLLLFLDVFVLKARIFVTCMPTQHIWCATVPRAVCIGLQTPEPCKLCAAEYESFRFNLLFIRPTDRGSQAVNSNRFTNQAISSKTKKRAVQQRVTTRDAQPAQQRALVDPTCDARGRAAKYASCVLFYRFSIASRT